MTDSMRRDSRAGRIPRRRQAGWARSPSASVRRLHRARRLPERCGSELPLSHGPDPVRDGGGGGTLPRRAPDRGVLVRRLQRDRIPGRAGAGAASKSGRVLRGRLRAGAARSRRGPPEASAWLHERRSAVSNAAGSRRLLLSDGLCDMLIEPVCRAGEATGKDLAFPAHSGCVR